MIVHYSACVVVGAVIVHYSACVVVGAVIVHYSACVVGAVIVHYSACVVVGAVIVHCSACVVVGAVSSEQLEALHVAQKDLLAALKARRDALQDDLKTRTQQLKELCIKEGVRPPAPTIII